MKILKNTLLISSYLLLIALFFFSGYALGRREINDEGMFPEPTVYTAWSLQETGERRSPEYEVIIEDGFLKIYKCIGADKTIIMSEKISESIFPRQDIKELKDGVRFDRLEAAQQMFENFVS